MRPVLTMGLVVLLCACGADGEPTQPTRNATITLSETGFGASGQVGFTQGPVSVTVGLGL